MIVVLCGGVGAARLLAGLIQVVDPKDIVAIVNTGDDLQLHGLSISPDLDTITYTLSHAIDRERGWGLANESWRTIDSLARYESVRPADSAAANTWFRLGDLDIATHLYRSHRLAEGASLTLVTDEIARAWGLQLRLLPMTDDPVRTMVALESGEEVSFQDYFVRLRHSVPVAAVRFQGADTALANPAAIAAIEQAERVIVAPSNPIVSLGPLLAVPALRGAIEARRRDTIAVSPLVGGRALKGPADRLLDELGFTSDNVGVARQYATIASTLVIDEADKDDVATLERLGMDVIVAPTIMSSPARAQSLARRLVGHPA